MDKKKKAIVAMVGVACIVILTILLKVTLFPSDQAQKRKNRLSISTPNVDDQKIKEKSKIEEYEKESFDNVGKSDVVRGFGYVAKEQEEKTIDESLIVGEETNLEEEYDSQNSINKKRGAQKQRNKLSKKNQAEPSIDDEIQQLMAMQEQLMAESMSTEEESNTDIEDMQKLFETYSEFANASQMNPMGMTQNIPMNQLTPEKVDEISKGVSEKITNQIQSQFKQKNHFHGAGSGSSKQVIGLIPAETVDQGVLVQGSTIAIRTKKEVRLNNPTVLIPKGAIVYGRISFATNRLLININSYKVRNQLYKLNFSLFDFDGVEGIHLGNRTWPKIPGRVTKDVYDYAYQKGTQAATFGNDANGVNLDEAKNIAILSASKEIGNEIFEKRRVFMPKKYHLWININTK